MAKLNNKQQRFVDEYLIDLNATQSAIRAGYSKRTAQRIGSENLSKPLIAEAIQSAMAERSKRTEITTDAVLQELAKIGFGNIRNLYDDDGKLMTVNEMTPEVTATIQEVTEETIGTDENIVLRRKFKVSDKRGSLELLGKHLKLFTDVVEAKAVSVVLAEPLSPEEWADVYTVKKE